jgi:hypothetical protein
VSKVWLIEALAWKRGANELAWEPTDTGSKPNLFPTLLHETRGNLSVRVRVAPRSGLMIV